MDNKAMYSLSYGLFVLTAYEYKHNGCIINTAMQVTTTPNRISITVNKQNLTHDMIKSTGVFNISVLSESVPFDIFKSFGFVSGRNSDKFDGIDCVDYSENGLIYLTKYANAYISGRVINTVDLGTHTMFIADVTDCAVLSDEKSVTYDYYHKNIKPKADNREKKNGYRCKICGYIHDGDELPDDFVCPICKHGAADFERI